MGQKTTCELLAPAGSLEKLKIAIHYGADAVYLGGQKYSLRAHATNFSEKEIKAGVAYAHKHGVKVYVTVNIMAHNRDLPSLPDYLHFLQEVEVDGLIISDPGIFRIARKSTPSLPIHLSTQANVTNFESARFWIEQGAKRLNLARELGFAELCEIREKIQAEIEVFVHGALCISYSGRCMLSNYFTGRNANQGDCAHPCRYSYRLEEAKRPGQFFPVEEDQRGTYIFNSKDLCLINRLPDLVATGVDSIKIEGRMKGIYYAGGMVRIYRAALDCINTAMQNDPGASVELENCYMEEISKLGSRGYTENFFTNPPDRDEMRYEGPKVEQIYIPAATVNATGPDCRVTARHVIRPGDRLEYMGRNLTNIPFEVTDINDPKGNSLLQANPNMEISMHTRPIVNWEEQAIIRKIQPENKAA
jgi:putative protease